MKKLINDPDDVVARRCRACRGARGPAEGHDRPQRRHPRRRPGAGQGRPDLRRRVGARADARRVRRPGHARRRLSRRGLHLAHPGPDAGGDQGGRRRRRRAAHRQELHRRRDELRDGRRAGRAPRASRSRRSSSTTTWPCRTACTPPAAAASAPPCSLEKICRRGGRAGPVAGRGRRPVPQGQRQRAQHGHGADLLHRARGGQAHLRARRRRDGDRRRHPRRARPRADEARAPAPRDRRDAGRRRSWTTCRSARATRCSRSSTAWAARR